MELKGQVILDEETMEKLKDHLRPIIINEIKEEGFYSSEIEEYLGNCDYKYYVKVIDRTIRKVISKIDKEDITFESDVKALHQIVAIASLLDI